MSLPFKGRFFPLDEEEEETRYHPEWGDRDCIQTHTETKMEPKNKPLPWGFHPEEKKKRNRPGFADRS